MCPTLYPALRWGIASLLEPALSASDTLHSHTSLRPCFLICKWDKGLNELEIPPGSHRTVMQEDRNPKPQH